MYTKHFLVLACAVALCACSDKADRTPTALASPPVTPARTELAGIVVLSGSDLAPVYLQTGDGLIPLEGNGALPMASVLGAEVRVRGTWDANAALVVETFLVTAVKGLPVFDGILEVLPDGYAIKLMADGSDHLLAAAPAALVAHVGARVWVTDSADPTAIQFGVIVDNQ
ncbi:MAG: hypothetical protein ACHQQ3_05525 [Gemmatimonadales bacterium]